MSAPAKQRARPREEAVAELGAAFKGAMAAIRRLRGRDTHRHGELSFAQYHLLSGLAERDELSAGELTRSERDRRVVTCTLTTRGRELITERRAHLEQFWNAALAQFSTQDLTTAAAVIDRLRAMFDDLGTDAHEGSRRA
jgi:DNA-binding MarR family transcriptional regulator